MRGSSRVLAGLAGAAVMLCGTPSAAQAGVVAAAAQTGPSNVSVSPSQVHQGALLTITASDCTSGGTVTSDAFPAVTLPAAVTTTATARVNNTATPGTHTLAVQCGTGTATASFTVLTGAAAQGGLGGTQTPHTTEMVLGGALTALAACTGAFLLSRRTRRTHHSHT
ncbi:hypothetical protein [Streptomyces sp. NBC_00233]|uniref:hypothetical protein n=1 Tax=Streptomyces sp. NBC_00233 TaxID=2975686 RepID=UPI00224CED74|nr:hypothetical protein [Streptomyces sp. NBC_00233]MCX5233202.1 hypothetical protein [Streptomyces sp. NBC_00233]